MVTKAVSLVVVTILLSAVIVGAMSAHDAEAKTSKQSPKHKFSKWTKKVCGDELCPGTTYSKIVQRIGKSSPHR